jgi:hypothetical protein
MNAMLQLSDARALPSDPVRLTRHVAAYRAAKTAFLVQRAVTLWHNTLQLCITIFRFHVAESMYVENVTLLVVTVTKWHLMIEK